MLLNATTIRTFAWCAILGALTGCVRQAERVGEPPSSSGMVTIGDIVQVSAANRNRRHDEVMMCSDPQDPKHLLAVSMISPSSAENLSHTVSYVSFDGGRTWVPTRENGRDAFEGAGGEDTHGAADPACALGPSGEAFFGSLTYAYHGKHPPGFVFPSSDGGKTWKRPVSIYSDGFMDRDFLTLDEVSRRFRGRLYITTNDFAGGRSELILSSSADRLRTLQGPTRFLIPKGHAAIMYNGDVLSDGTFIGLYDESKFEDLAVTLPPLPTTPNSTIDVALSHDGGETLRSFKIADTYRDDGGPNMGLPTLAVDHTNGPFRDRVYVAWGDLRSGRSEILVSHSSDGGHTWSAPVIVNDDVPHWHAIGPDDFHPAIAVNSNGVVGVMWYDRRDTADDIAYRVRFSASIDGAETFLPSVPVTTADSVSLHAERQRLAFYSLNGLGSQQNGEGNFLSAYIRLDLFDFIGGHTNGMAADARGVFHPLWVDGTSGINQLWTAPITVRGHGVRNGSSALAKLSDVSRFLRIDFVDPVFDRSSATLTTAAFVVNVSNKPIRGPVKLRVVLLRSQMGAVTITNAENGASGPGAIWTFSPLKHANNLKPGAVSASKILSFRFENLRPLDAMSSQTEAELSYFIRIDLKALGVMER